MPGYGLQRLYIGGEYVDATSGVTFDSFDPATGEQLATVQQATAVRAADVRRPVENEYLLAHQEYSPTTAIQGVRPSLRVVAADEQDALH